MCQEWAKKRLKTNPAKQTETYFLSFIINVSTRIFRSKSIMKQRIFKKTNWLVLSSLAVIFFFYVNLTLTGSAENKGKQIAYSCDQKNSGFKGEFSNAEMTLFTGGGD